MSKNARNASGISQGGSIPVQHSPIAAVASGSDTGTAAKPLTLFRALKKARWYGAMLHVYKVSACAPTGFDGAGTNQASISFYRIKADGTIGELLLTYVIKNAPTADVPGSTIGTGLDLTVASADATPNTSTGVDARYWEIAAGGGVGVFIDQGGTADLWNTGVVIITSQLAPADDPDSAE